MLAGAGVGAQQDPPPPPDTDGAREQQTWGPWGPSADPPPTTLSPSAWQAQPSRRMKFMSRGCGEGWGY